VSASDVRRALIALAAVALPAACRASPEVRAHDAEQRAVAHARVARSEIIRTLASPRVPGRIIYEKPVDLSYANLRKTRPDLDSAGLAHGARAATEKSRSDRSDR
jgi:hypothetical protein